GLVVIASVYVGFAVADGRRTCSPSKAVLPARSSSSPPRHVIGSARTLAPDGTRGARSAPTQTTACRPLRASDQLLTVSRGLVREQSRLDCLELALGERAIRPQPRDFLELRVPPLKGRRLDHGFLAPARQLTSAQTGG